MTPRVAVDLDHRISRILLGKPCLIPGVAHEHVRNAFKLVLQARDRIRVSLIGDDDLAVGALDHLAVRLSRVARVQRHPHGADDRTPEVQIGAAEVVVLQTGDPVSRPDTQSPEPVRQPHATLPRLGEGEREVLGDQRGAPRVEPCGLAHQCRDVHRCSSQPRGEDGSRLSRKDDAFAHVARCRVDDHRPSSTHPFPLYGVLYIWSSLVLVYCGGVTAEPTQPPWTTADDLTAKARIRNAALELYAAKGERNTTVREIAHAAGVTHGLVVHHFGNKDQLRRAVQQHVTDMVRQAVTAVPARGTPIDIGRARDANVARLWSENPILLDYLRRVLLDPADDSAALLELLTDLTHTSVRELRDAGIANRDTPEYIQVMTVLMRELAPRILQPVLEHAWNYLTANTTDPPPELEIKLRPADHKPSPANLARR